MTPRPASKPSANAPSLDSVFEELKAIVARYSKPFTVREGYVKNKRDYHLILRKPLVIAGRKRDELWFASIIHQKHDVGFYYSPVYCDPKLGNGISPELLKHLDGKSCFHFTAMTAALKKDIDAALKLGLTDYKKKGWL